MRLLRLGSIAMIAALAMLSACSSSAAKRPGPTSTTSATTTTAGAPSRSTRSTTTATTTTGSKPTTVPPPSVPVSALGGPKIVRLTGPPTPVQCNAPTSIELHWDTSGAASVTLRIDLEPVFATYGNGANDKLVPLACDGRPHIYTLTARAADGRTATRALRITERKL